MEKGRTTYTITRKGYHLLIDEIPAWICSQCGETYFEDNEVDAIQVVVKSVDSNIEGLRKERATA